MAYSLNKVMFIGNLGADPDVRSTPSGAVVVNFRIACTESRKDASGQRVDKTEWVTVVAWRQQAEFAQKYFKKGSQVYVEGKLQTRSWEDKNGGGKRYATEVLAERVEFFGSANKGGEGGGEGGGSNYGGGGSSYSNPGSRGGSARPAAAGGGDEYPDYAPSAPSAGGDDDLPF